MSAQEKFPYYPAEQPVPETPDPGSPLKPWGKTTVVGKRQPRVDGLKSSADRPFTLPTSPCREWYSAPSSDVSRARPSPELACKFPLRGMCHEG
jgi:hypothetical protein